MRYSLANAPLLGYDLTRRPSGSQVAGVLLVALAADPALLVSVANRRREGVDDAAVWRRDAENPTSGRASPGLRGLGSVLRRMGPADVADPQRRRAVLGALRRNPLGDVTMLDGLIHDEIFSSDHPAYSGTAPGTMAEAAVVIADSAWSWWADEVLHPQLAAQMRRPLTEALKRQHMSTALPALPPALTAILARLEQMGGVDRQGAVVRALAVAGPGTPWPEAMHQACWAAHLSGRTRTTAFATLFAVRAFHDSGLTTNAASGQLWNMVAGAVYAHMVADLLDATSSEVLLRGWEALVPSSA